MSEDLKHTCHSCGGHVAFPLEGFGLTVACPHCGQEITLGEPQLNPVVTPHALPLASEQKRSLTFSTIALSILALVGLLAGAWLITLHHDKRATKTGPQTQKSLATEATHLESSTTFGVPDVEVDSQATIHQQSSEAQAKSTAATTPAQPILRILALIGEGLKAIPPQLVAMESLVPVRIEIVGSGDNEHGIMHLIDGGSLFSNGQNGSWNQARALQRQIPIDEVKAKNYDGLWLFGGRHDDALLSLLADVRRAGKPIFAWNPDAKGVKSLGVPISETAASAIPADTGELIPAFANFSFEDLESASGPYSAQMLPQIPKGTGIVGLWEIDSRMGSSEKAHDGKRSLSVQFPGGQNGFVVRLGELLLPPDLDLEEVPITFSGRIAGKGVGHFRLIDLNTGNEPRRFSSVTAAKESWSQFRVTGRLPGIRQNRLALEFWVGTHGPVSIRLDDIRMTPLDLLKERSMELKLVKDRNGGTLPRWEIAQHPVIGKDLPALSWAALPGFRSKVAPSFTPILHNKWRDEVAVAVAEDRGRGRTFFAHAGNSPLLRDQHEIGDAGYWYRLWLMLTDHEPLPAGAQPDVGSLTALTIKTTPEFTPPGQEVVISTSVAPTVETIKESVLKILIRDRAGRLLKTFTISPASGTQWEVKWRVPDYGSWGAYFRISAELMQGDLPQASGTRSLYVSRRFDPREQIHYATWSEFAGGFACVNSTIGHLFDRAGMNAITPRGGLGLAEPERYGFMSQPEAGNGGIDNQFGWPRESFEEIARTYGATFPHARSSAHNLVSWGEEPGFGPAFGATYWWEDGKAPLAAIAWFHKYLRESYGNDLVQLNRAWQTNFKSFDEAPFAKAHTVAPNNAILLQPKVATQKMVEEFKSINRGGGAVSLITGQDQMLPNIAKYRDTTQFFTWHLTGVIHALIRDAQSRYPWAGHFLSQPISQFDPTTPVPGGWNHPFYAKENVLRSLLRQRQAGIDNPMARLDWYFIDDPKLQANMLHQQLAMGTFYFNSWYDFPLHFNSDLTDTQGGARMNRLIALVRERIEGPYLQNYAEMKTPVGMMEIEDAPFGIKFPRFSFLLPSILQTGQMPRFVSEQTIEDPTLKVLFFGQQTVSQNTISRLHQFVQDGGTLITLPGAAAWDEHGVPAGNYVHPDLVALTGVAPKYGLQPPAQVSWNANVPIRPNLNQAVGDLMKIEPMNVRHERLAVVGGDVTTCAMYPDRVPAVTHRRVGKGQVIHLNLENGEPDSGAVEWNHGSIPSRYAMTRLLAAIFAQAGVPEALPRFTNGSSPDGPHQLLWQRKHNATRDVTYLAAFLDARAGKLDTQILAPPSQKIRDLLSGKELPRVKAEGLETHFGAGEFRFLALRSEDPVSLELRSSALGPREARLEIRLKNNQSSQWTGQRPVRVSFHPPDGAEIVSLRRWVSVTGSTTLNHLFALDDVPGTWRIEAYEPVSGLKESLKISWNAGKQRVQNNALLRNASDTWLYGGTPDEIIDLLRKLRSVYLSGGDRSRLGYYLHGRSTGSRHALVRRLERLDWAAAEKPILNALRQGEKFWLMGEDLGEYPCRPHHPLAGHDNHTMTTVSHMLDQADRIVTPKDQPDTLIGIFGQGRLIISRLSADELCPPVQENSMGFNDKPPEPIGKWVTAWVKATNDERAIATGSVAQKVEVQKWFHKPK